MRIAALLALALAVSSAAAAAPAPAPRVAAAQAKSQWLAALEASARSGDRAARFPSPPRSVLLRRLDAAARRCGFRIVSVRMHRPLQLAPEIVIVSDRRLALARAVPRIVAAFDPRHPTKTDPSGFAYEGIFLVAETSQHVPYLAVFDNWRAPHVGGGQWAASEALYPYPHG